MNKKDEVCHSGATYTLRRNVHRLEKGLIMRPRRASFALDYLGETMQAYEETIGLASEENQALLTWAYDVLFKYYSVVTENAEVDAFRTHFEAMEVPQRTEPNQLIPYQRATNPLRVDLQGIQELAYRRRSVRWYLDKPVPRSFLDEAIEVAKLSPSACNRQPFSFQVFDDPEDARRVGAIPWGTKGFAEHFQCVIVIIGDLSAYFDERDRHIIYIDAGLSAMALQFALESQGVSSCCINWPDIEAKEIEMQEVLGLELYQRPIMCMSVGYPDPQGSVPYSQKKTLNEIRTYRQL
ncbi:nitroreductase family protein [Adhaeretor mobilis]|uniref:nitroreductase family protein n=1 Tax=Adhaeretor mobilis TaxID=1930276 RepID=UPI001C54F9D2|nr:nitroreductase family protein [Adhaeretor mobilis]